MSRGRISLKTIIVLVILVLVGVLGVLGMSTVRTYITGASSGSEPKNVTATPAADGRSATVSWTTEKQVQGVVEYGTTPASLLLRGLETDAVTDHKVVLQPLKVATTYYYRIKVGDEVFDNGGIPYNFKTSGEVSPKPTRLLNPSITLAPKVSQPAGTIAPGASCRRDFDYNGDGVVNSADFVKCIKDGGKAPPTQATSDCKTNVDYDGNGVINSLDRIKCLQNKTQ